MDRHALTEVAISFFLVALQVMPGHLATVGGMRDAADRDSSITAVREARPATPQIRPKDVCVLFESQT